MKVRKEVYPSATPERCGMPTEAIRDTIREIRETHSLELHSFLMLRGGKLIWEEYFREGEAQRTHALYSVSKSFTSTAMGIAEAQGILSLEDSIGSFFPELSAIEGFDKKGAVKLKHFLMMGSGFENNENTIFGERENFERLAECALSQPLIHEPGKVFNYYTLGTYMVSAAFSKANPEGIHSYLKRKLFGPMDFGRSSWMKDKAGVPMGGFGLSLTAYDMTKLGQLYLQGGIWEGQRLLPADYVKRATSKQISNANKPRDPESDWQAGYGYQLWRNSFGGYRADGMFGQYIVVMPELDAVVVMTSHLNEMQKPLTALRNRLFANISR